MNKQNACTVEISMFPAQREGYAPTVNINVKNELGVNYNLQFVDGVSMNIFGDVGASNHEGVYQNVNININHMDMSDNYTMVGGQVVDESFLGNLKSLDIRNDYANIVRLVDEVSKTGLTQEANDLFSKYIIDINPRNGLATAAKADIVSCENRIDENTRTKVTMFQNEITGNMNTYFITSQLEERKKNLFKKENIQTVYVMGPSLNLKFTQQGNKNYAMENLNTGKRTMGEMTQCPLFQIADNVVNDVIADVQRGEQQRAAAEFMRGGLYAEFKDVLNQDAKCLDVSKAREVASIKNINGEER